MKTKTSRVPTNETVKVHRVRCYDNGGETADRYTAVYMDVPESRTGSYGARSMNGAPFHPMGIGVYCAAMPGRHLGRRVRLADLPEDCQRLVRQDCAY